MNAIGIFILTLLVVSCEDQQQAASYYGVQQQGQVTSVPKRGVRKFINNETEDLAGPRQKLVRDNFMQGDFTSMINSYTSPYVPGEQCPASNQSFIGNNGPLDFESLTDIPLANCSYKLSRFSTSQINEICKTYRDVANGIDRKSCHVSNCTTASYIAILKQLRTTPDWESKKKDFTCRPPTGLGKAYLTFGGPNGLLKMTKEYGVGTAQRVSPASASKLDERLAKGVPRKGDPMLLQRKAKHGSTGHSVIFKGYKKSNGRITHVCYWSSNGQRKYNGASDRCESIDRLQFIDMAQLKDVKVEDV